jgi:hypothetical protein
MNRQETLEPLTGSERVKLLAVAAFVLLILVMITAAAWDYSVAQSARNAVTTETGRILHLPDGSEVTEFSPEDSPGYSCVIARYGDVITCVPKWVQQR